jgi:integrase-like protein
MAHGKRQYGSGCLLKKGKGWVIRWRELEIAPDGTSRRVLRFERLEPMSRREAAAALAREIAATSDRTAPVRSRVTFRTIATEWETTVLPMYKHSTQKHRRFMLKKHLLPRFGDKALCEISRQEIQVYVAHLMQEGYAPKSIDRSRCTERRPSHCNEVGTHRGESGARRRPAKAQNGAPEVGAHASASGRPAQ